LGVVTQHETRAEFLRKQLSPRAVWVVPNSPRGSYLEPTEKTDDFRGLEARDVVLLCIGTLGKVVCLDSLLQWFGSQDGAVKLVLHGWFVDKDVELYARQLQEAKSNQLIISDKLVDDAEKTDIYLSCDVVFVGFSGASENLRLAAGSAGKLYDALRTGRPVLAIDSPGMREIVEGNRVGKVVNNEFELGQGLEWIVENYQELQENCKIAHNRYSHDRHFYQMLENALLKK
jgi:glycosyltransferase involved in cell wall biosynthesis